MTKLISTTKVYFSALRYEKKSSLRYYVLVSTTYCFSDARRGRSTKEQCTLSVRGVNDAGFLPSVVIQPHGGPGATRDVREALDPTVDKQSTEATE